MARDGHTGSGWHDDEETMRAGVSLLAGYFPEEVRMRARERLVVLMVEEFRNSGVEPPGWMDSLREG